MNTRKTSITGRDSYIIAQALAYASEMLKHLGLPHDEPSNRADMDAILDALYLNYEQHRAVARAKLHNDPECILFHDDGSWSYKYPSE